MTIKFLRLAIAYSPDEIRGLSESRTREFEVIQIPGRHRWTFVPHSTEADDGVDWLLPSWNTADRPGRWERWQIAADSGGGGGGGGYSPPIPQSDVTNLVSDLAALAAADAAEAAARAAADAAEAAARAAADAALAGDIATEAAARAAADSAEATARATADAEEAIQRQLADSNLRARIEDEIRQRMAGDSPFNADHILASQVFGG